jgi:adenylate kinase
VRLLLIGPNGAGKGTQGVRLAERYRVPHVATGDLLRFAVKWETEIGFRAKQFMEAGELVPDEVVLELLRTRLSQDDASRGFVLDGFPRNEAQATALNDILAEIGQKIDAVVSLEVPDEILVERLSSRASCPTCGRTYMLTQGEPKLCVTDRTALFQRNDDKPDVVRHRLEIFKQQTRPLIEFYESQGCLVHVDGIGEVREVEERIAKELAAK